MSDRMVPIPFEDLMESLLRDAKLRGEAYSGVPLAKPEDFSCAHTFMGQKLESPLGVAAGPHSQLASNILACYLAGARVIELKTVQKLAGEDLHIDKPCIRGEDEVYNVEWSTELTVADARDEYIKAWFACHVAGREFGLGEIPGLHFNMSVGYDLEGIKSESVTNFLDTLNDAKGSECWNACMDWLKENLDRFEHVDEAFLERIPSRVCQSVSVSTMHGCPVEQIEEIVRYLIVDKKFNTILKCNPTLVGLERGRELLDATGYDYVVLDPAQFEFDLKFEEAVPLIKRLAEAAKESGVHFAIKLSNTLPVKITRRELPGETMYMSGKSLYPLTINVAARLNEALNGEVPISYCGGVDKNNIQDLYKAGLSPLTVCSVLLQPQGVPELKKLGALLHEVEGQGRDRADIAAVKELAEAVATDKRFKKSPAKRKQFEKKIPYEATRQLDSLRCRVVCGICSKICPNRANEVLVLEDGSKLLVHFDTLCNYCGACQFLCPEPCHPFEDRLNFFSTKEQMMSSENQGLTRTENGWCYREGKEVKEAASVDELPELYAMALRALEKLHG